MFEFFEKIAEGIGFKIVDKFSDKVKDWIDEVFKSTKENQDNSKNIATSGENSKVASSGDSAKVASSGYYAQVASSGYSAQVASSGDYAKVASSGYSAQVASSGYSAQVASSGDSAKVASSGDYAKVASSGDYAKVATSGDYSKVASSGDYSVGFICGKKSIIKAKKGTWISIAEFARKEKEDRIYIEPTYALSAQIGNSEYRDYRNRILKEDVYYILYNKKFHPVYDYDGIYTIELSYKIRDGITIIKSINLSDIYDREIEEMYVAVEGNLSAHGYTLREAIDDLMLKKLDNIDKKSIVEEIRKTGKVTRSQYRALTGACSYGTNKFCEQHKIEDLEEISLEELRKILIDDYGAKTFWRLIDNKEEE